MALIFPLFVIFNIYIPHTFSQALNGGVECLGVDACKATNLKCRPNRPCEIICNGKSACTDSTISANGATSFHLICIGEDSCKSGLISCGTDKCQIDCITYNLPNTNVCYDIFVHTNHATSFQCTGECPQSILDLQYTTNPTSYPTLSPTLKTNNPTIPPTNIPSKSPIIDPTYVPTKSPTYNPITSTPTKIPSNNPTNIPSISPSNKPTKSPSSTLNPSFSPSINPSISPSNYPSLLPTNRPTIQPTLQPTLEPTIEPTLEPTNIPSKEPTNIPTIIPTNIPTILPTNIPTILPTNIPTILPTNIPTKSPIITDNPSRFPTINPTKTPTNYPTINPTKMPIISPTNMPTESPIKSPTINPVIMTTIIDTETTETINDKCATMPQNISSIFASIAKSTIDNGVAMEIEQEQTDTNLISHGIILTITFNTQINIHDATNIIYMVSEIMNELIHITIPNNCLQSDPLEIKSVHSYVAMSIIFHIFVCNNNQQQQLINIFNTNKNIILCKIIHSINNEKQIQINIQLNSATLKTDTIQIHHNNTKNPINTTQIITNNKKDKYYGNHGNRLQLILLIMVGTLAITSILIACAIFILNSKKISKYANNNDSDSDGNDTLTKHEINKILRKQKSLKKLSITGIEIESSSSRSEINLHHATSDPINFSEVNLHHATSDPMNLSEVNLHIDAILEAGKIQNKCQCSCHDTEILAANDCILRARCDTFGSHSGCNDASEQKQCCVIQEALYRAQMKSRLRLECINGEYGMDSDDELPKHAIV